MDSPSPTQQPDDFGIDSYMVHLATQPRANEMYATDNNLCVHTIINTFLRLGGWDNSDSLSSELR